MKMEPITESEILSAQEELRYVQRELMRKRADKIPPGWKSASDYAREAGIMPQNVKCTLNRGASEGILETRKFKIATKSGLKTTTFYRLAKQPGK